MPKKKVKISGRLFTWFVVAGFVFLFAPRNLTNKLQLAFVHTFRRPLSVGRNLALLVQRPSSAMSTVSRSRYNQLRNKLCNTTQWLHQERKKVEELSGLRDRSVWEGVNFVLADVITVSIRGPHNELIINGGKNDGLAKGQFVLGDYSVIGTISDVDLRMAQVKLTTDLTSRMAVKIAELEVGTMIRGNGNNSAKVELLPRKHKIETGDVVYAQKKLGFLDVPMIVGTVAQCKIDDENPLLWDITVKPACEVNRLTKVTVVVMNRQK